MTQDPLEMVVADKEKFSLRLGAPQSFLDKVGKPMVTGGVCAATGALAATHIIGPATVVKVLGVTLYASSGPVGWAIGTAVVAFGTGYTTHVLGRKIKDRFGTIGTYRKDFDGSLSEFGKLVADMVFRPMAALALSDWSDDKWSYILHEFDRWGYDKDWSRGFLEGLRECKGDILRPTLKTISRKGFGRREIKDKTIMKRHLRDLAIENLCVAASEFGGDQEIVRKRKEEISRQLKEKFRD